MSILEDTTQVGRFRDTMRGKIEMIWTCIEERCWVCRGKDAEDVTARQERKDREEVYG